MTDEQIMARAMRKYPVLRFNQHAIDPSVIGLKMADIRKINRLLNTERKKYITKLKLQRIKL
jgi:hypothetical protein